MAGVRVYLGEGFDHDRVLLSAAGVEVEQSDVTTRQQVGLAVSVELAVPAGEPLVLTVSVPDRGLTAEAALDPEATPHVLVGVEHGSLTVRPEADPPRFA